MALQGGTNLINKPFYQTFVGSCATFIAIMMAFYGGLVVYLGQQARTYKEEVVKNLQELDTSVEAFCRITEPVQVSWANWSIPMEQESNMRDVFQEEEWKESPVEVLDRIANCIANNNTEAEKQDEQVRDWLDRLNVTRFLTHYLMVTFSLHDLVDEIYKQFPPPPGKYDFRRVEYFVSSDFPSCEEPFSRWAERYKTYYSGVSEVYSKIHPALQAISEAHLDSAKLSSQRLEELLRENRTGWEWYITTEKEGIQYHTAMSTYYGSVLSSLQDIDSLVSITVENVERWHQSYSLAFSDILNPVGGMIGSGVVVPMLLLGLSDLLDSRQGKYRWWRWWYLVVACTLVFSLSAYSGIGVIWNMISALYFV